MYNALPELPVAAHAVESDERRFTFSAVQMPLQGFLSDFVVLADVSIVAAEVLDNRVITFEAQSLTVSEILSLVARRLGVQVSRAGNAYFLGELRPEDRGVMVRRVFRLSAPEITAAVEALKSDFGRVTVFQDGLTVIADRVEVLQRLESLFSQLDVAPADSWVIQFYMIARRTGLSSTLGVDVTTEGIVAARLISAAGLGEFSTSVDALLSGVLRLARTETGFRLEAAPLFVLADGESARLSDGDQIRIPRYAVSPEGTLTPVSFESVRTGMEIEVRVRDGGGGRARLELESSTSQLVAVVDGLPQTNSQEFSTVAWVESGGAYLLGALHRSESIKSVDGVLRSVRDSSDSDTVIQIWARAYRVAGPVHRAAVPVVNVSDSGETAREGLRRPAGELVLESGSFLTNSNVFFPLGLLPKNLEM